MISHNLRKHPCDFCVYADISDKPRTIIKNGMKVVQSPGGIICTAEHIAVLTFTDGEMTCSSYKEKIE